jgi:hypothetical protein
MLDFDGALLQRLQRRSLLRGRRRRGKIRTLIVFRLCRRVVQWQDSGLWIPLSRFESWPVCHRIPPPESIGFPAAVAYNSLRRSLWRRKPWARAIQNFTGELQHLLFNSRAPLAPTGRFGILLCASIRTRRAISIFTKRTSAY